MPPSIGIEAVAVDVADRRIHRTVDRPRDLTVRIERLDDHLDVVLAEIEVPERVAVHVHEEPIAHRFGRLALGRHQHARRIDGNVP